MSKSKQCGGSFESTNAAVGEEGEDFSLLEYSSLCESESTRHERFFNAQTRDILSAARTRIVDLEEALARSFRERSEQDATLHMLCFQVRKLTAELTQQTRSSSSSFVEQPCVRCSHDKWLRESQCRRSSGATPSLVGMLIHTKSEASVKCAFAMWRAFAKSVKQNSIHQKQLLEVLAPECARVRLCLAAWCSFAGRSRALALRQKLLEKLYKQSQMAARLLVMAAAIRAWSAWLAYTVGAVDSRRTLAHSHSRIARLVAGRLASLREVSTRVAIWARWRTSIRKDPFASRVILTADLKRRCVVCMHHAWALWRMVARLARTSNHLLVAAQARRAEEVLLCCFVPWAQMASAAREAVCKEFKCKMRERDERVPGDTVRKVEFPSMAKSSAEFDQGVLTHPRKLVTREHETKVTNVYLPSGNLGVGGIRYASSTCEKISEQQFKKHPKMCCDDIGSMATKGKYIAEQLVQPPAGESAQRIQRAMSDPTLLAACAGRGMGSAHHKVRPFEPSVGAFESQSLAPEGRWHAVPSIEIQDVISSTPTSDRCVEAIKVDWSDFCGSIDEASCAVVLGSTVSERSTRTPSRGSTPRSHNDLDTPERRLAAVPLALEPFQAKQPDTSHIPIATFPRVDGPLCISGGVSVVGVAGRSPSVGRRWVRHS